MTVLADEGRECRVGQDPSQPAVLSNLTIPDCGLSGLAIPGSDGRLRPGDSTAVIVCSLGIELERQATRPGHQHRHRFPGVSQ